MAGQDQVSPDAVTDPDARARVRRVAIRVFAVQIITLVALWLLSVVYGVP